MPDHPDDDGQEPQTHLVIGGRRWRATDPHIPGALRQELVDELMAARRAVKAAETDARQRVADAKVALGERGFEWWDDDPDPAQFDQRVAAATRALLRKRHPKTICPSDVARIVRGESWRRHLDDVRRVAAELVADGTIEVTQKGEVVDLGSARGPVRLRFPNP